MTTLISNFRSLIEHPTLIHVNWKGTECAVRRLICILVICALCKFKSLTDKIQNVYNKKAGLCSLVDVVRHC